SGPLRFGDVRLPEGEGPHPLAVVVHGGFWRATVSLIPMGHLCHALAHAGVATWNLEYRRIGDPGGGWPGTFDDVARGVEPAPRLADAQRPPPAPAPLFRPATGRAPTPWRAPR